jgi:hypothetical protein
VPWIGCIRGWQALQMVDLVKFQPDHIGGIARVAHQAVK